MSKSNAIINSALDALAQVCCDAMNGKRPESAARTDSLIRSLVMSGYARSGLGRVSGEIQSRVRVLCPEITHHRGAQLGAITHSLDDRFTKIFRWETNLPPQSKGHANESPSYPDTKAANISSMYDA